MNLTVSNITKKRLINDLKQLRKEPHELVDAYPDDNDSLLWYFLLRGPDSTDYKGGFYIGKVLHNPEYPIKPPDFVMLTPNGRFDIEKKICLTNSGYHEDSWSAMWNMKTLLEGLLSIMADDSTSGLSHIKRSPQERRIFAEDSISYNMTYLYDKWIKFERFVTATGDVRSEEEIKQLSQPVQKKHKNTHVSSSVTATEIPEYNQSSSVTQTTVANTETPAYVPETPPPEAIQNNNNNNTNVIGGTITTNNDTANKNPFDIYTFNVANETRYDMQRVDAEYDKLRKLKK